MTVEELAQVVASMDWPEVTKYRGIVSAQTHRVEIIQDLYKPPSGGMIRYGGPMYIFTATFLVDFDLIVFFTFIFRELLVAFYKTTKRKPDRIIFYR